jgi:hypothetical protein
VPVRIRRCRSATAEVRVKRGSTWMIFAPRSSFARIIHWKPTGCASAGLAPLIITRSAFLMSRQWLVMAPRPNVAAKLTTVGPCQTRACCSR